jgi:hypothetical protein
VAGDGQIVLTIGRWAQVVVFVALGWRGVFSKEGAPRRGEAGEML